MTETGNGAQQRYSVGGLTTGVLLVVSLALFVGGIILLGYMLGAIGYEIWYFIGGMGAISLSLFIPFSLIKFIDGA